MLNDAFRTLRDPIPRAEYFLKQRGIELSKDVPPELLEEVFELNMALEELRGGDESARPQLDAARERFDRNAGGDRFGLGQYCLRGTMRPGSSAAGRDSASAEPPAVYLEPGA